MPQKEYCSGKEKALKIEQYKNERANIPCKHFKGTIGSCPFGSDCIFAHIGPEGQDLKRADKKIKEMKMTRTLEEEERVNNNELLRQESTIHNNNQQLVQENHLHSGDIGFDDNFSLPGNRGQERTANIERNIYETPHTVHHNSPRPRDQHRLIGDDGRADDLLDQLINGNVDANTGGAVPEESSALPDPMSAWSSSFHNRGRESQTVTLSATSGTDSTLLVGNAYPREISFFDTLSNLKGGTDTNTNTPSSSQGAFFGNFGRNSTNDFNIFTSDLWDTSATSTSANNINIFSPSNTRLDVNNEDTNENTFLTFETTNDSNNQSLGNNFIW